MTTRSAKRTTPQTRWTTPHSARSARRLDLQINLADRALGWIIPGFIGAATLVAVWIMLSTIAHALTHLTEALP